MDKECQPESGWIKAMRWLARALTLLATGLYAWFLVESGARLFSEMVWGEPQGVPLFVAILAALLGVLAAWRWELVGGLVAIAGSLTVVGLVVWGSGTDMLYSALWFIAPFLAAGGLYLVCCAQTQALIKRG